LKKNSNLIIFLRRWILSLAVTAVLAINVAIVALKVIIRRKTIDR